MTDDGEIPESDVKRPDLEWRADANGWLNRAKRAIELGQLPEHQIEALIDNTTETKASASDREFVEAIEGHWEEVLDVLASLEMEIRLIAHQRNVTEDHVFEQQFTELKKIWQLGRDSAL